MALPAGTMPFLYCFVWPHRPGQVHKYTCLSSTRLQPITRHNRCVLYRTAVHCRFSPRQLIFVHCISRPASASRQGSGLCWNWNFTVLLGCTAEWALSNKKMQLQTKPTYVVIDAYLYLSPSLFFVLVFSIKTVFYKMDLLILCCLDFIFVAYMSLQDCNISVTILQFLVTMPLWIWCFWRFGAL
jgi:hypothetical protein